MEPIMGTGVRAAMATRRGVREFNMDAAATMRLVAETAVRIGPTRGALAGLLAAAVLVEDPGVAPDGVAVLALAEPDGPTLLAWVGDSHAYGWDGTTLRRRTDPHTMGAYLRQNGDLAPQHDNWVRLSLAGATPTTVALSHAPAGELVLLVSDGLDDLPLEDLAALVAHHHHDPQALVDAIVATAEEDDTGYRDDAIAVVLCSPRDDRTGETNPDNIGDPQH